MAWGRGVRVSSAYMPVFLFLLTWAYLAGTLGLVLALRSAGLEVVGEPLHRQSAGLGVRASSTVVLALALVIAVVGREGVALSLTVPTILLTWLIVWLRPIRGEESAGLGGVRSGWRSFRIESFEEWRLVGEHLRFRCGEEWMAVRLPAPKHAALEAELKRRVPERESPYR